MRRFLLTFVLAAASPCASAAPALAQGAPGGAAPPRLRTVQGSSVDVATVAPTVGELMERCGVNGLALAVVDGGRVTYTGAFGTLTACGAATVGAETVFRAGALGMPVFAYLVMRLADRRAIDLDTPLFLYLPRPLFTYPEYGELRSDMRFKTITARRVLSHQAGFPDWRWQNRGERLDIKFPPGQRFGFSSEGYRYLQFVLETKLGRGLQQLAAEEVFRPLGMSRTSFVLEERFDGCLASGAAPVPGFLRTKMRSEASAAASLLTTAADYGAFMAAATRGEGLKPERAREMLAPQVQISSRRMLGPLAAEGGWGAGGLAWSLGWGRFDTREGSAVFHPAREAGCENYAVVFLEHGIGMVVLAVGEAREAIAPKLVARLIGDGYSPFQWAGY